MLTSWVLRTLYMNMIYRIDSVSIFVFFFFTICVCVCIPAIPFSMDFGAALAMSMNAVAGCDFLSLFHPFVPFIFKSFWFFEWNVHLVFRFDFDIFSLDHEQCALCTNLMSLFRSHFRKHIFAFQYFQFIRKKWLEYEI